MKIWMGPEKSLQLNIEKMVLIICKVPVEYSSIVHNLCCDPEVRHGDIKMGFEKQSWDTNIRK